MSQNYTLFIDNCEIVISNFSNKKYNNDDEILNFIENLKFKSQQNMTQKTFNSINAKTSFKKICKQFKVINAGGGIVFNEKNQVLLIKRFGFWDLPKGKQDKGEPIKLTALREVIEECGINILALSSKVGNTYHCYKQNDKWFLKKSYWYLMNTWNQKKLTPQIEENITEVKWVEKNDLEKYYSEMYPSIKLILKIII